MRFLSFLLMLVTLASAGPRPAGPQAPPAAEKQKDQFFAGYITALSDTHITVTRTVLGDKSSTRTFVITPETRVEGKPKVKSRVTVQYVSGEEGDRAVQIIVRTPSQKKPG